MIKIADLLDRDFSTPIEEIIKVNNADEDTVHTELTEYVATPRIKDEYQRLFQAMAAAPSSPNEGVGVWISGFFGSGKSSFAKNLGYVLANRTVLHESASDLFLKQVDSQRVTNGDLHSCGGGLRAGRKERVARRPKVAFSAWRDSTSDLRHNCSGADGD